MSTFANAGYGGCPPWGLYHGWRHLRTIAPVNAGANPYNCLKVGHISRQEKRPWALQRGRHRTATQSVWARTDRARPPPGNRACLSRHQTNLVPSFDETAEVRSLFAEAMFVWAALHPCRIATCNVWVTDALVPRPRTKSRNIRAKATRPTVRHQVQPVPRPGLMNTWKTGA